MQEYKSEVLVTIDYISTTSKGDERKAVHPDVAIGFYADGNGKLGYNVSRKYMSGVIQYFLPSQENMGTHVVYSGKALKYLREKFREPIEYLKYHIMSGHTIARLDIAVDFIDKGLDIERLFTDYEAGKVKTRVRSKATAIYKSGGGIETMYVGSMKKRSKVLRIYNKAIEQGIKDVDWIRVEYEVRGKNATRLARHILEWGDWKQASVEAIKGFCDFTDYDVWNEFVVGDSVSLPTKLEPSDETIKWLLNTCAPSLARASIAHNGLLEMFIQRYEHEVSEIASKLQSGD